MSIRRDKMKKLAIVLVAAILVTVAYAAVEVTLTVPTEYAARIIAALRAAEDAHISVMINKHGTDPNDKQARNRPE
jgi:hypothetical protein